MKIQKPDVSHWLIDASLKRGSLEADREWLNGDSVTIVIAGRFVSLIFLLIYPFSYSLLTEKRREDASGQDKIQESHIYPSHLNSQDLDEPSPKQKR